ncbi:UNKNOWN [Stylonychia lemnae]|uniref:Uncharacterized protein n=1 Tax=Stylonychia lemnae TaxID=5949 RepID=A0A078AJV4_STYLE|nr:UNKNOWN [Stylonychia lemnae]|eukprot:CDW81088.1 UNKNOWN [Stylonychia lemnae]
MMNISKTLISRVAFANKLPQSFLFRLYFANARTFSTQSSNKNLLNLELINNQRRLMSVAQQQEQSQDPATDYTHQTEEQKVYKDICQYEVTKRMKTHFPGLKLGRFPQRVLSLDFEKDILTAEKKLMDQFGFVKEEINYIMRYKPAFILFEHNQDEGMSVIFKVFVEQRKFELDAVRTLVVKYPYILSKSEKQLNKYFETMKSWNIADRNAMKQLVECPKLISQDLDHKIKEISFLLNLYHGISDSQVRTIFMHFPYLLCCDLDKVKQFMGEFKKYRFTKEQVVRVVSISRSFNNVQLKQSGGILASRVGNFKQLFDYCRKELDIPAKDVVEIIDAFPEFIFQNKRNLLQKKVELIQKHSKCSVIYLRTLIKRHPDLFLKSWASFDAKVNYISKQLGRQLKNEKTFPMLLMFNYQDVLKPRCELLKESQQYYQFEDVLPLTDEAFCEKFNFNPIELEKKKDINKIREEKDILWAYVPGL